jgi:hypothetical protein
MPEECLGVERLLDEVGTLGGEHRGLQNSLAVARHVHLDPHLQFRPLAGEIKALHPISARSMTTASQVRGITPREWVERPMWYPVTDADTGQWRKSWLGR